MALAAAIAPNIRVLGIATVNPSAHAFMLGRLVDSGMAQRYLAQQCPGDPAGLMCDVRARLDGLSSDDFLWSPISPVVHEDMVVARRQEYQALVRSIILFDPVGFAAMSISTAGALLLMATPLQQQNFAPTPDGGWLYRSLNLHEGLLWGHSRSRQQAGEITFAALGSVHNGTQALALGLLGALLLPAWRSGDRAFLALGLFILVAVVANALLHGATSGAFARYQAKVSWLSPLVVITQLVVLWSRRADWRHRSEAVANVA